MFHFFKREKEEITEVILNAITIGKVIPLEQVPDKMFAEKMMGDGVGFVYDGDMVCAPCNGTVTMLANTKHAIGMKLDNGAELLIHVGLDTVSLNGKGLEALVQVGDKVKQGQAMLQIDRVFMEENKIDLTTPMIMMMDDNFTLEIGNNNREVNTDSIVMKIYRQ